MDTVNKYEEVSKYFPLQEWNNLPKYEKNRFHNLLINYNKMCELGFSPRKPDFMLSRINKTKIQKLQKENDEEWTPNKVKQPKWNPPRKLAGEVPSVEKKIEDQAFVQFTAADISRSQEIYQCLLQKIAELRNKLGFEDVPEYQLPTQQRYPRRQIERKDYREREVPDDDDYIYCDECEREWEGDCPEHGALVNVPDTEVPDTENGPDRAEKTVPKELCIAQSSIHNAGKGVWTRVLLQKGLRFGPYEGVKVDSPNGEGYCWQIRRNQRNSHYVDAWDSSRSNWMRFVNCARHEEEQNLIAFQYKGEMYYRTFRTIRAHVELLVWYGDDFGRELGIDKENYHKPLPVALKRNIFPCISCSTTYSSPVYLHNHFRHCHMRTSNPKECLEAATRNKLVVNERVCLWQCKNCKHFENKKHISSINSGLKLNKKDSKREENGAQQLLHTNQKCPDGMKNYSLSCMDFGYNESTGVLSECPKIFRMSENLNTRELKSMKDAPITSRGLTDGVDILMMTKNITKYVSMYPKQQNFKHNVNYRPYTPPGSLILGTQLDECSPSWKSFYFNFTLCKHRNKYKIYQNKSLNDDALKTVKISSTPLLSVINPTKTPESAQSIKCNEKSKPMKNSIQKFDLKIHPRKKSYECNVCQTKFSRKTFLMQHVIIHLGGKGNEENICQKKFTQNGKVVVHKETRSGENPCECTICLKKFAKNAHVTQHKRCHFREKSYECSICKKKFTRNSTLITHERVHSRDKPYECSICEKKFTQNSKLIRHKIIHSGEKPYECNICGKKFTQSGNLMVHKRVHSGDKPYECSICEKKFTQNSTLMKHKIIHSGEKPYECNICGKKFTQSGHLALHKRIHSGEKPHECNICEKKFITNSHLVMHKRIHSGEKPYECNICGKKFTQSSHLMVHKRIHSGERPHECTICENKFIKNSDLVKHKRIHSGEKPYECNICEKKCSHNSDRKRHQRIHSGEKPYQCSICWRKFTVTAID